MSKENLLAGYCMSFAIRSYKLGKFLIEEKHERVIGDQILRCGTSIGANRAEAEFAESREDFIHKLRIARKEANEALFWIELMNNVNLLTLAQYESIKADCEQIIKLMTSIILSTKQKE